MIMSRLLRFLGIASQGELMTMKDDLMAEVAVVSAAVDKLGADVAAAVAAAGANSVDAATVAAVSALADKVNALDAVYNPAPVQAPAEDSSGN